MALFARRIIQRYLDESTGLVGTDKLRDWTRRLNKVSDDYVATEWEVVLLRAFARFGNISHEPPQGQRRIDLIFKSFDRRLGFGAEITAISDRSLHARNPTDRFQEELGRHLRKAGITTGRFIFRVEEERPVPSRGSGKKRRLLLPPFNQFQTVIFDASFKGYLAAIQREPGRPRDHRVYRGSPAVDIALQYRPERAAFTISGTHALYTGTTVNDDNPLFNALKEKAVQLRRCRYEGVRGVIVCDMGARILTEEANWSTYSAREVVSEFLRQNKSTAFVVTIGVKSRATNIGARIRHTIEPRLFVRDTAADWARDLDALLGRVVASLPAVRETPDNALNSLKWNRLTRGERPYLGGTVVTGNEIRISARELLDLLAGRLDQEGFARNHDMGGGNIFSVWRARGRTIRQTRLERCPDEDDDWVVLEFEDNDPAVCNFTAPGRHTKP